MKQVQDCINYIFSVAIARCLVFYRSYDCLELLSLGFVRSGAFPAIRLPLFVQSADAHSLTTTYGNILLHKAGQHA